MKFHEYLTMRVKDERQRGVNYALIVKLAHLPWPDVIETFPEARKFLEAAGVTDKSLIIAARGAYNAYRKYLKFTDLKMPMHPREISIAAEGVSQAVTDAPDLAHLCDLEHSIRRIGWKNDTGRWTYCGDLTDPDEYLKYITMRDMQNTVKQYMYTDPNTKQPVLFARVRDGIDPAVAYKMAGEQAPIRKVTND